MSHGFDIQKIHAKRETPQPMRSFGSSLRSKCISECEMSHISMPFPYLFQSNLSISIPYLSISYPYLSISIHIYPIHSISIDRICRPVITAGHRSIRFLEEQPSFLEPSLFGFAWVNGRKSRRGISMGWFRWPYIDGMVWYGMVWYNSNNYGLR